MRVLLLFVLMLEAASLEAASFFNKEQEAYWLKLLHYKNVKSRAQGPAFFLSPMGKTNPEAELQATIETLKGFYSAGK